MFESIAGQFLTASRELRNGTIGVIALAIVLVIAIYWATMHAMAGIWIRSDTFAHGLIVAPMSLYLIFRERRVLAELRPEPYWSGLGLLLMISCIWLAGRFLGVNAAEQFAAVSLIPASVLTLAGPKVLRAIAFPMVFLFFAVPFGEFLIPQLMEITADLTTFLLQITGFPVYRDGLFLAVPGGDFEIATACSGIRYLIASIVLGTIFAYLTFRTWRKRMIFIGLSIAVPILANGVRAYLIVVLASLSGMRLAVGVDHLIYGWLFFGFVMFILFGIGVRFRDDQATEPARHPFVAPSPDRQQSVGIAVVAAVAVMLVGPALLHLLKARAGSGVETQLADLPAGWTPTASDSPWQPSFQPSDQSLRRALTNGATTIYEFVDVYRAADGGVDATSSGNALVDKKVWRIDQELAAPDPDMRLVSVRSRAETMYVATWYQNGPRRTASVVRSKLYEAWDMVVHGGSTSAIVVFAVDADERNIDGFLQFIADYHPALSRCLADPRHSSGCAE